MKTAFSTKYLYFYLPLFLLFIAEASVNAGPAPVKLDLRTSESKAVKNNKNVTQLQHESSSATGNEADRNGALQSSAAKVSSEMNSADKGMENKDQGSKAGNNLHQNPTSTDSKSGAKNGQNKESPKDPVKGATKEETGLKPVAKQNDPAVAKPGADEKSKDTEPAKTTPEEAKSTTENEPTKATAEKNGDASDEEKDTEERDLPDQEAEKETVKDDNNKKSLDGSKDEADEVSKKNAKTEDSKKSAGESEKKPEEAADQGSGLGDMPDVEDSHFFYYLLFFIVLGAAVYVGIHNKKKILGLLIEGRRPSGTRRSGVRYRRLSQHDDNDSLSYRDTESSVIY